MTAPTRSTRALAYILYSVVFGIWLVLTVFLWRSNGNPQAWLCDKFGPYSRSDAFDGVNQIIGLFWRLHIALTVIAGMALFRRRYDVLTILLIGPSLAAILVGFEEDWSDPAWFTITGLLCLGYLAGIPVTLL